MDTIRELNRRLFLLGTCGASLRALAASPADQGFRPLFDGKTLEGWTQVGTKGGGYSVKDGRIVLPAGSGARLFTSEPFGDFILRFEFKLEEGSNNGLAIRCPVDARDPAYDAIELQILDNTSSRYKDIKPWQAHGSLYGVFPAKRGHLRPTGEWNRQEVTARGSRIKVVLNGATILDADTSTVKDGEVLAKHPGLKRTAGRIGFLGHDDPIELRNIRIKEL